MITQNDLQLRLEAVVEQFNTPGAAVAVVQDDQVVQAVTGTVNVETGYPVLPSTWFAAGSVTKVFTATLVMMLVDQGQLDLDEPVLRYLPDFRLADKDSSDRVTSRMLLTHTSGLPANFMLDLPKSPDMVRQQVEALADFSFNSRPGELWSYSNAGLVTLGRIVEMLTGTTWDQALTRMLLQPLGINGSSCTEDMILHSVAIGHVQDPTTGAAQRVDRFQIDTSNGPTGATLWLDIAGLAAFGQLHLRGGKAPDGTHLLSAGTVEEMQRVQATVPWGLGVDAWGLGWYLRNAGHGTVLGHTGANSGAHSILNLVPEAGGLVAVMANGSTGAALYNVLANELLEELFDIPGVTTPTAPDDPVQVDLRSYPGIYIADDSTATVRLAGDQLVVEQVNSALLTRELTSMGFPPPAPVTLTPLTENGRFLASSGMPVSFVTPHDAHQPEYLYLGRVLRRVS